MEKLTKKYKKKNSLGITLIALVVTIIVLIILAGVSINLVLGDNGIITIAKKAKENMELATQEEQIALDNWVLQMDEKASYNEEKRVNAPQLLTGMTPIKFSMPTDTVMGVAETTTSSDVNWYEYGTTYETRKWANAKTQDGSMWVWIPRYAYKINQATHEIDVVFLIGTTDKYYDTDGKTIKTAQRQTKVGQTIDTTADYTVHPAFTNESTIGFANGGWDSELTGIWVAKFKAGYASGNNTSKVVASNVNYSQTNAWVQRTEAGTTGESSQLARNWLDGIYGDKETAIKYPTFQGTTYAMNYINMNDAYKISKALTDNGNIYGLSKSNTDSHLMKNSEWGAVAYLSQSKYGQNKTEITTNNINLNSGNRKRTETEGKSGVDSVYAVTGCSSNTTNTGNNIVTIESLNAITGNTGTVGENGTAYKWNQKTGQNASTTGTIYGIYDISGGLWERTAGFVSNGNINLYTFGKSLIEETGIKYTIDESTNKVTVEKNTGTSKKYVCIYPNNEASGDSLDIANQKNFANNTKIYGDAVRETTAQTAGTSNTGWNKSSWNNDFSSFPGLGSPFFGRGGDSPSGSGAGAFSLMCGTGVANFNVGFRAVLVSSRTP